MDGVSADIVKSLRHISLRLNLLVGKVGGSGQL